MSSISVCWCNFLGSHGSWPRACVPESFGSIFPILAESCNAH